MSRYLRLASVAVAIGALTAPSLALTYEAVVTWEMANQGGPSAQYYAAIGEGTTVWSQLAINQSGQTGGNRIVKTTGVGTSGWSTSVILDQAAWTAASSQTNLVTWYGFSMTGDYLQFGDTGSDAIWRVHRDTGAISAYVTKSQIQTHTGGAGVTVLAQAETAPNGEFVFYEGTTDSLLMTNGAGALTTLANAATLTAMTGTSDMSGGIAVDSASTVYWGNNTNDSLFKRLSNGTISTVLTAAQIQAVSGGTSVSFKDIFAAPDGRIYFNDNTSKDILRFSPLDPVGTLQVYMTGNELLGGPASTDNIYQINWYDGKLAFNVSVTTAGRGYYVVVPEPAGLALLGLGFLVVRRRRVVR